MNPQEAEALIIDCGTVGHFNHGRNIMIIEVRKIQARPCYLVRIGDDLYNMNPYPIMRANGVCQYGGVYTAGTQPDGASDGEE